MTAGKLPEGPKHLEPAAEKAVRAGTRYRLAQTMLLGGVAACAVVTLVLVAIVVLQGPGRSRRTQQMVQDVHSEMAKQVGVLKSEIAILQKDIDERQVSERRVLSELEKQLAVNDEQTRRYLLALIQALKEGRPLTSVTVPARVVITQPAPEPRPSSTARHSQPAGGRRTSTSPAPAPTTTSVRPTPSCIAVILGICIHT